MSHQRPRVWQLWRTFYNRTSTFCLQFVTLGKVLAVDNSCGKKIILNQRTSVSPHLRKPGSTGYTWGSPHPRVRVYGASLRSTRALPRQGGGSCPSAGQAPGRKCPHKTRRGAREPPARGQQPAPGKDQASPRLRRRPWPAGGSRPRRRRSYLSSARGCGAAGGGGRRRGLPARPGGLPRAVRVTFSLGIRAPNKFKLHFRGPRAAAESSRTRPRQTRKWAGRGRWPVPVALGGLGGLGGGPGAARAVRFVTCRLCSRRARLSEGRDATPWSHPGAGSSRGF